MHEVLESSGALIGRTIVQRGVVGIVHRMLGVSLCPCALAFVRGDL